MASLKKMRQLVRSAWTDLRKPLPTIDSPLKLVYLFGPVVYRPILPTNSRDHRAWGTWVPHDPQAPSDERSWVCFLMAWGEWYSCPVLWQERTVVLATDGVLWLPVIETYDNRKHIDLPYLAAGYDYGPSGWAEILTVTKLIDLPSWFTPPSVRQVREIIAAQGGV